MLLHEKLKKYRLVLGSASPRRQALLKGLDAPFELRVCEVNEEFPETLFREGIPMYLAEKKSMAGKDKLQSDEILITADTIVWLENKAINKPENLFEARQMLEQLSGKTHEVITAVCLRSLHKVKSFFVVSQVHFRPLNEEEINYYIDKYKPLDKAGAYGVQEWIGYIGVDSIQGSFYNIMGLPVKELYDEIIAF